MISDLFRCDASAAASERNTAWQLATATRKDQPADDAEVQLHDSGGSGGAREVAATHHQTRTVQR